MSLAPSGGKQASTIIEASLLTTRQYSKAPWHKHEKHFFTMRACKRQLHRQTNNLELIGLDACTAATAQMDGSLDVVTVPVSALMDN